MEKLKQSFLKGMATLLLTFMAITMADVANAQQSSIKTNLANLFIGGGSIQYEHVLNETSTAQLGGFFTSLNFEETQFSGFGVIPQYRFYPGKNEVPHGFFVAPLISYHSFSLQNPEASVGNTARASYTLIGGGFDIGKQWLINRGFSIELSAGATFNSTNLKIETSGASEDIFDTGQIGSFAPRFGLSLGYAF